MKIQNTLARVSRDIQENRNGNPDIDQALALVKAAQDALARAESVGQAVDIRDKVRALEIYLKQRRTSILAANQVVAQRLRIERAIGRMIDRDGEIHPGGRLHDATLLSKYGISKYKSKRWQDYAYLDDQEFETWVSDNQETSELSGAWLLKLVKDLRGEKPEPKTWQDYRDSAVNAIEKIVELSDGDTREAAIMASSILTEL